MRTGRANFGKWLCAGIGLRMAGLLLRHLVHSGIGKAFVAVNLPLLHGRTLRESGDTEFRAGGDHSSLLFILGTQWWATYTFRRYAGFRHTSLQWYLASTSYTGEFRNHGCTA
jgi:hypothetical protein